MLGSSHYQHNRVNQWTSSVVEQCLNQLTKLGKPYKYIGERPEKKFFLFGLFIYFLAPQGVVLHFVLVCLCVCVLQ